MAEFYLHEEDWDQARKVAESGLILLRQSEKDYGGPLLLYVSELFHIARIELK